MKTQKEGIIKHTNSHHPGIKSTPTEKATALPAVSIPKQKTLIVCIILVLPAVKAAINSL